MHFADTHRGKKIAFDQVELKSIASVLDLLFIITNSGSTNAMRLAYDAEQAIHNLLQHETAKEIDSWQEALSDVT